MSSCSEAELGYDFPHLSFGKQFVWYFKPGGKPAAELRATASESRMFKMTAE